MQDLIKCDAKEVERYISLLKGRHIDCKYKRVRLDKVCPACKKDALERQLDAVNTIKEIPIIPLYVCSDCGERSYYLTKEYLLYLVETKRELFDKGEAAEYEKDSKKFVDELKEYVIRIFASKRILCIR